MAVAPARHEIRPHRGPFVRGGGPNYAAKSKGLDQFFLITVDEEGLSRANGTGPDAWKWLDGAAAKRSIIAIGGWNPPSGRPHARRPRWNDSGPSRPPPDQLQDQRPWRAAMFGYPQKPRIPSGPWPN